MSQNAQHVVPNGKTWSVRKVGALRASAVFKTRAEAVERARQIAINLKTELFIHGQDGRIQKRNSYGNDYHPPKG